MTAGVPRTTLTAAAGLLCLAAILVTWWHPTPPGIDHGVTVTGLRLLQAAMVLHAGILLLASRWSLAGWRRDALLPSDPPPAPPSGREYAALGAMLLLALLLRLVALDSGLWFDEIQTLVEYVRHPLADIVLTFDSQNQHLLFSILARVSVSLFGESAWALRLPAVVFGVGSLWATWRLGREIAPPREALLATGFLAVSYHHVWFSQNARGYTALLFWTVLATLCLIRLLTGRYRGQGWAVIAGYAVAAALALYTHLTAGVLLAAHAVVVAGLALRRPRADVLRPLLALALAGAVTLLLYAPVLPQVADTILGTGPGGAETSWQSPAWLLAEAARNLRQGLTGGEVALTLALAVGVVGLWSYGRQHPAIVGLLLLPAVLTAVTIIALHHNLWPRFFFFSATAFVLIGLRGGFVVARTLTRHGDLLAAAGGWVLVALSAATVPKAWGPKQDYAGAARHVDTTAQRDDAVLTVDMTAYPYRDYLGKAWPIATDLDALRAEESRHQVTRVLYTFPVRLAAVQPAVWEHLQARYRTEAIFPGTIGGGAIVVAVTSQP